MRCGLGAASSLMPSGRTIEADEALTLRLVDEVVEPASLLDVAIERARSYGENPTPRLRWIKQRLTQNANETDPLAAQARELSLLAQAAIPEHKEAVAAFLEKRPSR